MMYLIMNYNFMNKYFDKLKIFKIDRLVAFKYIFFHWIFTERW